MSERSTKDTSDDALEDDLALASDGSVTVGGTVEKDESEKDSSETGAEHDEQEGTAKVDSELEDAETDEEREAIRERRRKERKSRSVRARERVEHLEATLRSLQAQNQTLAQQVAGIQDANAGSQIAQMDTLITQADQAAEHFKKIIAAASTANDGTAVADATEYMIAARQRAEKLRSFKDNATRAMTAPKPLNPVMVSKSSAFLGRNKWYTGPESHDPDSKVLTLLDNGLTNEGWDSTTDAYWQELERRAAKYLPHRVKVQEDSPTPGARRPPVTGSSTQSTPNNPGAGKGYTLSPARVQAIKDAGMWDNVAERNKMVKEYRDYDRNNTRS